MFLRPSGEPYSQLITEGVGGTAEDVKNVDAEGMKSMAVEDMKSVDAVITEKTIILVAEAGMDTAVRQARHPHLSHLNPERSAQ